MPTHNEVDEISTEDLTAAAELYNRVYKQNLPLKQQKQLKVFIPLNDLVYELGEQDIPFLLKKYKNDPKVIQFLADMIEI